jgi:hypothetical protein
VRLLRNITVTVEPEVARWARVKAAREDLSLSRLIGKLLKDRMLEEKAYELSRRRFLAVRPRRLSDGPYPGREELHDRSGLR